MISSKGKLLYIHSINNTLTNGGAFYRDFSHIVGTTTEVREYIPAGQYPTFNDYFGLYEVKIDEIIYFLHEDDCEVIEVPNQLDFADIEESFVTGSDTCCSSPRVVKNTALGDIFFVCTNCKKEVNEGGKLC